MLLRRNMRFKFQNYLTGGLNSWYIHDVSHSRAWVALSYFLWEIFFSVMVLTKLDLFGSLEMSISAICHICYHKAWLINLVEIETMCSKEERDLTVIKPVTEVLMIQCLSVISYTCFLQASSVPVDYKCVIILPHHSGLRAGQLLWMSYLSVLRVIFWNLV